MKRSKYSFHDFCAKHTPSATLITTNYMYTLGRGYIFSLHVQEKLMPFCACAWEHAVIVFLHHLCYWDNNLYSYKHAHMPSGRSSDRSETWFCRGSKHREFSHFWEVHGVQSMQKTLDRRTCASGLVPHSFTLDLNGLAWFPGSAMLCVTRARWTTIDSGQNRTESLVHTS